MNRVVDVVLDEDEQKAADAVFERVRRYLRLEEADEVQIVMFRDYRGGLRVEEFDVEERGITAVRADPDDLGLILAIEESILLFLGGGASDPMNPLGDHGWLCHHIHAYMDGVRAA